MDDQQKKINELYQKLDRLISYQKSLTEEALSIKKEVANLMQKKPVQKQFLLNKRLLKLKP